MLDFQKIENEKLRSLMMASPAIASLDEKAGKEMIARISLIAAEKQESMISVFEKERADLDNLEKNQVSTLDADISQINSLMAQLNDLEHQYDAVMREYSEGKSTAEDKKVLDQLMEQLNSSQV